MKHQKTWKTSNGAWGMTEKIWENNEEKIIFVSASLERGHDRKLMW